jgi:hypothetical protein
MKWRVVLELVGSDATPAVHEVSGGAVVAEYAPRLIGLTLAEGKHRLAAVQRHLVEAQTADQLPALWHAAAAQRSALSPIGVAVRHGGSPCAALYPMPARGELSPDAQSGCRDRARPMHARV